MLIIKSDSDKKTKLLMQLAEELGLSVSAEMAERSALALKFASVKFLL